MQPEQNTELKSQNANVHSTPGESGLDLSETPIEPPAPNVETTAIPSSTGYTIGTGDLLQITIFNIPPTEEKVVPRKTVVQVGEGGRITVPLLGEVQATGKTAHALEQELHEQYKTYIRDPQIGVLIKNAGMFFVDGAVRKPGSYPLDRPYTLTQALIAAGGLDYNVAKYNDVTIARRGSGTQVETINVDLNEIRAGNTTDPPVYAGDVILVAIDTAKYIIHRFLGSVGASAPIVP